MIISIKEIDFKEQIKQIKIKIKQEK